MRTLITIAIVALMGTAARPADAKTTSTPPSVTVTLADSIETAILTLEAAGKIDEADSLRKVETAKAILAARTAAAATELAKRNEATWDKELKALGSDMEKCYAWPTTAEQMRFVYRRWLGKTAAPETSLSLGAQRQELRLRHQMARLARLARLATLTTDPKVAGRVSAIEERLDDHAGHFEDFGGGFVAAGRRIDVNQNRTELLRSELQATQDRVAAIEAALGRADLKDKPDAKRARRASSILDWYSREIRGAGGSKIRFADEEAEPAPSEPLDPRG